MDRSNLLAAVCFKLFLQLFCIRIRGEPVHLTIVASIHLLEAKAPFDLHFLRRLSFLEIDKNREVDAWEEIIIHKRVILCGAWEECEINNK